MHARALYVRYGESMNVTLCILGYLIVCNGVLHGDDNLQIVLGAVLAIMAGLKELLTDPDTAKSARPSEDERALGLGDEVMR